MAGGYLNVPSDGLDQLMLELKEVKRRLSEIERPSGLVEFGSIGLSTTAFTIPTSYGYVAEGAMDIPEGFSRAAILGVIGVGAYNNSGSGDYIYVRCMIDGSPGAGMPEFANTLTYRAVGASAIRTLDGLVGGGSISVGVQCRAASGWGSSASNIANIDVIALFRR